jgi:hypothetical protein
MCVIEEPHSLHSGHRTTAFSKRRCSQRTRVITISNHYRCPRSTSCRGFLDSGLRSEPSHWIHTQGSPSSITQLRDQGTKYVTYCHGCPPACPSRTMATYSACAALHSLPQQIVDSVSTRCKLQGHRWGVTELSRRLQRRLALVYMSGDAGNARSWALLARCHVL